MSVRTFWKPLVLAGVLTALVLTFHYSFPSIINNLKQPAPTPYDELGAKLWRLHSNHPAFAGRPLTSLVIGQLHTRLGLSFTNSFTIVNFSFLFLAGALVYVVAREYNVSPKNALLSLPIFYGSFTILFSFFRSIDTYDEPLQYCFIFLSLLLIHKQKWSLASITLFVALLARETTVFLYPAIFFYFAKQQTPLKTFLTSFDGWKKICYLSVPLVAFLFTEQLVLRAKNLAGGHLDYFVTNRFTHWHYNIQNSQFALETIISIFLTLALPLLLLIFYRNRSSASTEDRKLIKAFLLTAVINTVIVLVSARAREARLFALPLVFLWPLLGSYLHNALTALQNNWAENTKRLQKIIGLCIWLASLPVLYYLTTTFYHPTYSGGFDYGYQLYLFFTMSLVSLGILFSFFSPKTSN